MNVRLCIPLALGLCALAPAVRADDSQAYPWKAGELLEVEFNYEHGSAETSKMGDDEDRSSTTKKQIRLVYIDRVDEVQAGRVVKLTRHFKTVRLVEDGREVGLDLAGRNVTLKRDGRGEVRASWVGGGSLPGNALFAAEVGPWPDVDRDWGLGRGTRDGSLAGVPSFGWERPAATPTFVSDAVDGFGLANVGKGTWSLTVSGGAAPAGKADGKVNLEGRESEETDEGTYASELKDTVTLSLVRKKGSGKLPEGAPPADDGDEPMPDDDGSDDEDPMPDDDDDGPLPDDDDDPIPAPDEDDPLPDDEDSNQED